MSILNFAFFLRLNNSHPDNYPAQRTNSSVCNMIDV